jgi:N-ethylmaleimide reductase
VQTYTRDGLKDIPTPRALDSGELPQIVREFRAAAENAKAAGFDGVEVHGANGYLLDQSLESGTNQRTDAYGGSVENRARLLFEVLEAVIPVWGSQRIGVRLSPGGSFNDMCDANPQQTFGFVARHLNDLDLGYLHLIEPTAAPGEHATPDLSARFFRPIFHGTLIVAGGYTLERGNAVLQAGLADLVAFGRLFLANPDLVERFRERAPLNEPNPDTFYGGGAEGYTDYPTRGEAKAA